MIPRQPFAYGENGANSGGCFREMGGVKLLLPMGVFLYHYLGGS